MLGFLTADPADLTSIAMPRAGALIAETTPPPPTTTDYVSALPSWLLVALLILVASIIAAMFILTFYNLSAPRSTLKNVLGLKPPRRFQRAASPANQLHEVVTNPEVRLSLIETLSTAARVGKRTTRTTLAITGFALLGVVLVAVFGVSGQGMREIRGQVVTAIITLVAAIAGFYFGSESAARGAATNGGGTTVTGTNGGGTNGAGTNGGGTTVTATNSAGTTTGSGTAGTGTTGATAAAPGGQSVVVPEQPHPG